MQIIYDIDGIICPDYPRHLSLLEGLSWRREAPVLFRPDHPFSLLTGRHVSDTGDTLLWLIKNNLPFRKLWHRNSDVENPAAFKLLVLKALLAKGESFVFYESDEQTVEYLRNELPEVADSIRHFNPTRK